MSSNPCCGLLRCSLDNVHCALRHHLGGGKCVWTPRTGSSKITPSMRRDLGYAVDKCRLWIIMRIVCYKHYQEVSIKRPPLKEPKSPKWGGARFASIRMEVLNAPPYKIFRNRGVRVSLPFPFFHCFVETPLKIPPKNVRLRRAWGVRVSLPTIFPKWGGARFASNFWEFEIGGVRLIRGGAFNAYSLVSMDKHILRICGTPLEIVQKLMIFWYDP